ncbi:MAG: hypothetical protein FD167_5301 [bacterium]|nr:MAG: hypothetical protein FD167_5301 [bacterium]
MATYFEQITARVDHYDLVCRLKKQRNQLIKAINVIAKKLTKLEDDCLERKDQLHKQVEELNLPIEIFDEIDTSQEQLQFLSSLAQKDDYLSELYQQYEDELIAIEEEIFELKNQPLSVAA